VTTREPIATEAFVTPQVSPRGRRWTRFALIGSLLAFGGLIALNEIVERQMIDYANAEEIYDRLKVGGFGCDNPFFPKGSGESEGYSSAVCERGFTNVHIDVNVERGQWLGSGTKPYESGEAAVTGSNWTVSFEAPDSRSARLAREAQMIVGGVVVEVPPPQEDF
jgi:hypothetical protein